MDNLNTRYKETLESSEDVLKQGNKLLQTKFEGMSKPVVVAWGLMNAGKSYLLNMLTEHIDSEFFKTNDFRETAEVKRFETDNFIFLDTPGLDASNEDNLTAIEGVGKADIVLFVHQLQGELEAVELGFLQDLVESFGDYASDNIIIVLSKVDKESEDKVEEIKQKVLQQCETYVGFEPKCIAVSNTVYKAGAEKKIQGLIKNSNIEALHDLLQDLAESIKDVRKERHYQNKEKVIRELEDQREELDSILLQFQQETYSIQTDVRSFNSLMNKLTSFMTDTSSKYTNL